MTCESVLRDPRNCSRCVHEGIFESRFDHVPPHGSLSSKKQGESGEAESERLGQLFAHAKVDEGTDEGETDYATKDTMAPFHEEDEFKVFKRH